MGSSRTEVIAGEYLTAGRASCAAATEVFPYGTAVPSHDPQPWRRIVSPVFATRGNAPRKEILV